MGIFKKIHYNSPVILTYTIISLIVLLINIALGDTVNELFFSVYRSNFLDPLFYVRLIGHVIGHQDFNHYFGNFILILLIGPMLEEKYGSKNLFFMIIFTALITGLLNIILTNNMLLGASGVAFMLIILTSFTNIEKGKIPLTFILVIIIFIGQEIFNGITTVSNISQVTHIIGGICGAFLGFAMNKKTEK